LALEAAATLGVPLPGTAVAQQMFQTAATDGAAEEGTQALVKALEKLANTRVSQ
jgi:2-hydroxy-3-oxopropionate reductase